VSAYASALQALGDPTRLEIFERITQRPHAVRELADELPVTRPAVSQHLRVLKDAGLVIDRADGTRRIYQVNPEGVDAVRRWLDGFWDEALARFKEAVD
jgi:DNA-binding transcriptional ArsR family regulator